MMLNLKTTSGSIYILLSNVEENFLCDYIQQTAKILGKNNCVLITYYTSPTAIGDLFKNGRKLIGILEDWFIFIKENNPGIHQCKFISVVPFQRYRVIYEINKRIAKFELNALLFLKKIFSRKNYKIVLWLFHPTAEFFINKQDKKLSLYDYVDYLEFYDNNHKLQERLLSKVDYVFANSYPLSATVKNRRDDVIVVSCGCATDQFNISLKSIKKPNNIESIKGPLIGFCGHIDYRIDYILVEALLRRYKNYSFIFIGKILENNPLSAEFRNQSVESFINILKRYPNFYHLPSVPKKKLINYLHYFNVALVPYNITYPFVFYSNPMKFYEYLTIGIPVISSPIPSLMQYASSTIKFASSIDKFCVYLKEFSSLKPTNDQKKYMRKIAEDNSWNNKVSEILDKINE